MQNPEMKRLLRGAWWGRLVFVLFALLFPWAVVLLGAVVLVIVNTVMIETGYGEAPGWLGNLLIWPGLVFVVGWYVTAMVNPRFARSFLAEADAPRRFSSRVKKAGAGGSAAFSGAIDEWPHQWDKGRILLGPSIKNGFLLGTDDDRGLLTIATSRSGKGVGVIIPNLLRWTGSAIVIDPKGTNAAVTMRKRREMGQTVHVVDPFGVVKGVTSAAFNPLDAIDVKSRTLREDIGLVVDALVVPGKGEVHWDESARMILSGVIAYLCATVKGPTLVDVRKSVRLSREELDGLLENMLNHTGAGQEMTEAAAVLLQNAGPNERGAMMTTVMRNTAWLDSAAVANVLSRSSFHFRDAKNAPTTVYAVLPPHLLEEHRRFLRLFVNTMVRAASIGGKAKVPVLLMLDEFYALGQLKTLAAASGALASYGLRLWPFVQNLTQLKELYPENWQTFFANAGTVQMFAVNDLETAKEISARLGQSAWIGKMNKRQTRVVSNLLETTEIAMLTGRFGGLQLILMAGEPPILARKLNYYSDRMFRGEWDTDPDFEEHGDDEDEDDQSAGAVVMN